MTSGVPWVSHDGYSTTANAANDGREWVLNLDRTRIDDLWDAYIPMTLVWWFTDQPQYLHKAAELVRVFFLNQDTAMNPNLRYGALLPLIP
jgi:hypothetical protein